MTEKPFRRATDINLPLKLILNRLIGIALFLSAAFLTGSLTWVIKSGYIEAFSTKTIETTKDFSQKAGFKLDEVLVQGRRRTDPAVFLRTVALKRGTPIMSIDIIALKDRVETMPWVNKAIVERKLPNIIHIVLEEREPIALWQNDGKFMPIDTNGNVINVKIDRLTYLPIVVGENAPAQTAELLNELKIEPELKERVKAAILVGDRRWNIMLDDIDKGISIKLPEENADKAWSRLAKLDKQQQILKRKLTMIDLRLPDKMIVKFSGDVKDINFDDETKKGRRT
ncbi:MAG: cell division protein FtsQ/DivIB [Alphaproteobacteria bacterium]